jgi:putative DNA methylase
MERRFIEESFPIKKVGLEAKNEEGKRNGHIRTLHKWWARRPLSISRATSYSSFINSSTEKEINEFIIDLSKWENSNNELVLKKAKKQIQKIKGVPKVLDPFSGGGSIPLELARLGCETYANDYNPVAAIILKCILEFPQKFSREQDLEHGLIPEVKKWGEWVFNESKKELKQYYPAEKNGDEVIGYHWARTIPCQNPRCGVPIPLLRSLWLTKKGKKIGIFPYIENNKICFKLIENSLVDNEFMKKANNGTISNSIVTCLSCGMTIDASTTRKLFQDKKTGEIQSVIILEGNSSKKYKISTIKDKEIFEECKKKLNQKRDFFIKKWGLDPIPSENLPPHGTLGFRVQKYGMLKWEDLFNERQKLSLIIFTEKIREAYDHMLEKKYDKEFTNIIITYLGINLDNLARSLSSLTRYRNDTNSFEKIFARSALEMVFDYGENNPIRQQKSEWHKGLLSIVKVIDHCSKINNKKINITCTTAAKLPFKDEFFDAVITDPPYYDNVPYSYLSDFFYVWLKKSVGHIFPEWFVTPLVPKSEEIVAYKKKENPEETGKDYFERKLKDSFFEISRILKTNGVVNIVYAHKSTEGWETLINSLLTSGLIVTAAWPIRTELSGRLRSQNSATLASSIYMICRKWKKEPIGFYRDVKNELKQYLNKKLEQLWGEGISGADLFISAIGSAIEVFGKYEKVIDDSDKVISVNKLLNDTRKIVTNYAINKVIKGDFSDEISTMTRFYILWRWAYGESKVPFNDALKMAQSIGINLEHEWNKGFIVKETEFIHVLGPDERNDDLKDPQDLIDILHKTLQIWKKGKMNEVDKFLEEKEYKNSDVFKRVAQAISESLPLESTEKKWLDGFLTGFKSENSPDTSQSKLFFEEGK